MLTIALGLALRISDSHGEVGAAFLFTILLDAIIWIVLIVAIFG